MKFNGTSEEWIYKEATDKFDACTVSKSGKIIGYSASNSHQDRANERLRAAAQDLLYALLSIENNDNKIPDNVWKLRNEAIEKALKNDDIDRYRIYSLI